MGLRAPNIQERDIISTRIANMFNPTHPKLVIFGNGSIAEMALDYFSHESEYEIVGHTVDQDEFEPFFNGAKVYPFDIIEDFFDPKKYEMFIACGNNDIRKHYYDKTKKKGYKLASFISPYAYLGRNISIGDNCFILENNVIQYGVKIGDNTTVWSNNHIGHNSKIGRHCFLASGITISGHCNIGDKTFIGSGVSTADQLNIAENSFIKVGTIIKHHIGNIEND